LSVNAIQSEEIQVDSETLQQLTQFHLLEQPIQLQDHFIRVRHAIRKHYVEVVNWERYGYEIRYTFERELVKTVFKIYFNGEFGFNNSFAVIPKLSVNEEFNKAVEGILNHLPASFIKRNTAETVLAQIEFEFDLEELFPFTRNLFDDITSLINEAGIYINHIEHQQYKERYTFKRSVEIAVIDFEYTKKGFFGRVMPIQNHTNSLTLVSDIQNLLQTFKQEDHAY
jgi:hypothetical protein